MKKSLILSLVFIGLLIFVAIGAWHSSRNYKHERGNDSTVFNTPPPVDSSMVQMDSARIKQDQSAEIINFARTLKGIPYKYGSTNPNVGFDCSGFITYVYNHFNMEVPRSSVEFTNEGTPVALAAALPGDLILFTGTDSSDRTVGHMGIITTTGDSTVFIHSTSGKANGVTETTLNDYYMGRFVKVIRFPK